MPDHFINEMIDQNHSQITVYTRNKATTLTHAKNSHQVIEALTQKKRKENKRVCVFFKK
jgi:hypothetical protein